MADIYFWHTNDKNISWYTVLKHSSQQTEYYSQSHSVFNKNSTLTLGTRGDIFDCLAVQKSVSVEARI